jgi:hypothetical protein
MRVSTGSTTCFDRLNHPRTSSSSGFVAVLR